MATLHAVVVPFPAQGHVNPLMNFAELLARRGFYITFVNTEWIDARLLKAAGKDAAARDLDVKRRGLHFRFLTISDDLPPEHGRTSELGGLFLALQKLGPALQRLLVDDKSFPPITCIVSDSFISCAYEVAQNLGVPRVIFWTCCTANSIVQTNANFLLSRGHIPVTGIILIVLYIIIIVSILRIAIYLPLNILDCWSFLNEVEDRKSKEKLITCLPGNLPPIRPTDIVSFYREEHFAETIWSCFLYESEMQNKADYWVVNTFEELEGGKEPQTGLSNNGSPALAIGPVSLPNFLEGRESMYSMWEEDQSCLQWLDAQRPQSVLYISFGSITVKSEMQLQELALGLEATGYPFLWVLRADIAEGKSASLPEGFMERTQDRALIVGWSPQLKVLSHPSVGGFLTHSGWNSTLEAIYMGVPMLGWPYFFDQFIDSRFARDVWKVGLDFEGVDVDEFKVVRKEEVESKVRDLMEGEIGKELRQNAIKLKEAAAEAVRAGGSSYSNIDTFVEDMRKIANSKFGEVA